MTAATPPPMMSHGPCGASMLDAAFTLDGLPTSELLLGTGSWPGPWGPYTCGPLLGEGAGGKGSWGKGVLVQGSPLTVQVQAVEGFGFILPVSV